MKKVICVVVFLLLLTGHARAAEIPKDLTDALPEQAEDLLRDTDLTGPEGFTGGVAALLEQMGGQAGAILRQRVRGAAAVLLVVVLCATVDGLCREKPAAVFLPMAGALSITLLTAGSLDSLLGLGRETIGQLSDFSKVLLPTLAAATAAAGGVSTATVQQVTTVFLVDLLVNLIHTVLLPLVYLYIGVLAASAALPENRLGALAEGVKKAVTWVLTTALLLFTVYLSVARVITGAADAATVKVAKAAISGAVPVVGGIISEAAETVLAGAGVLKNTIGVFGTLAILAACAYPFLQLGIQYLLYKLTAFLAAAVGAPQLCRLIDGLGGAFGLVLGMTGSCALLLLVSVLSSVAAVAP
jgi:stage III sporulation protein AE